MSVFNPLIDRLSVPPIPAVQAWGRAYGGAMGPLIDLSQAVPGYPPHADLLRLLAEKAGDRALAGYGEIEGEAGLRDVYAAHVSDLYGASIHRENIHVTAGCNQAFVVAAMAVAGPGDALLLTNPCYFNHETSLQMLGIAPRYVDCDPARGFLPHPVSVAEKLERGVKALALVSPNNPTGAVYPPDLLVDLYRLCRDRGVWLILDETYRDFLPPDAGRPHALFSEPGWEEGLIGLYSFSKSFCIPGHRLGAVTAGAEAVERIARIMDNLQICAPRAPQAAVAQAFAPLADWRATNRREIAARATALDAALGGAPGWELGAIGAYFAFVRHPFEGSSSTAVAERLAKDAGLIVIPGSYFGAGQERYLRFAFANADAERLAEVGRRLAALTA